MPTAWSATVNRSLSDRIENATLNALAALFIVAVVGSVVALVGLVVVDLIAGGAL